MREINPAGLALVKEFEGLRLVAYDDLAPNKTLKPGDAIKGTLTIGHGHTGPDVFIGQTITAEEAERLLLTDLAEAQDAIGNLTSVPLNENQYSALVSFVYNVGAGNFQKSTLRKKLNRGDFTGAAEEFQRWNKAKGQVLAGLTRRRAAEKALFLKPVTSSGATESPDDVKPKGDSAKDVAKDVATGGGVASAFILFMREALEAGADLPVWLVATGIAFGLAVTGYLIWKKWRK